MPGRGEPELIRVNGHDVPVTNPRKVLFPDAGYTKLDLVQYYLAVAEGALRGAGGRPNVLVRYPNGITGDFFYQKRAPTSRPDWIEVVALQFPSGRTAEEIVPRDAAGLAYFDGTHLYQVAEARIQKIDPKTGAVLGSIPAPAGGGDSGLAWAEGALWVGHYRERKIYQVDPTDGRILRTLQSDRFVTGVTWLDGELWHATLEGEALHGAGSNRSRPRPRRATWRHAHA